MVFVVVVVCIFEIIAVVPSVSANLTEAIVLTSVTTKVTCHSCHSAVVVVVVVVVV